MMEYSYFLQVATGAFMFLADLVRKIALPLQLDFVRVQSYGNDTKTSGVATISTDCKIDLKEKHIIVVCCNTQFLFQVATTQWLRFFCLCK